jgi:hypothetical protein
MGVSDDYDDKRDIAIQLLLQKKVLAVCPIHTDEIIGGQSEVFDAYKIAAFAYKKGEYPQFEDQREFTDYLKEIYDEFADCECGICGSAF